MFASMLMGDVVVFTILGFILRRPWNWLVLAGGGALTVWALRHMTHAHGMGPGICQAPFH